MTLNLSLICFAEADDTDAHRSLRETQDMQAAIKSANSDVSDFAVVMPQINMHGRSVEFELSRPLERQMARTDISLVLVRVEGNLNDQIVCTL